MAWIDVTPQGDGFRVHFDARTWEAAHEAIRGLREDCPTGYRVEQGKVRRARLDSRAGKRCKVEVTLFRVDGRVEVPTVQTIRLHVERIAEKAIEKPARRGQEVAQ